MGVEQRVVTPDIGYKFRPDWFSEHIPNWEQDLAEFRGKPNLHFLEIGSFEGRSAVWLLTNILTDSSSSLTCVDNFQGTARRYTGEKDEWFDTLSLEDIFRHNIGVSGAQSKVTIERGKSQEVLPRLVAAFPNSFDFIYIDGSHKASDVSEDARDSFRLLKVGGVMTFDDYVWDAFYKPAMAIDHFLEEYIGRYELIRKSSQVTIKKLN